MRFLRPHRFWITLLVLAAALMIGRAPALHFAGDKVAHNLADIKAARAQTEQNLRQLRDDVATAHKLGSEMDLARAAQILAPADRLKAATALEKEAVAAKIARFTYTFAPEERLSVNAGGAVQALAVSNITVAGDTPDDLPIYTFVENTRHLLPGRVRLRQLIITRTAGADAPFAETNTHFEAMFEWLSNGTLQTVAGGL